MKRKVFWPESDPGKYSNKRIPGMIVTSQGTIIVYYEARTTSGDWALMDILCQRSVDGGKTFDIPVCLAAGDRTHPTANNPVMIQDKNGRIHFLHCEDYGIRDGRILRRFSDDDGVTWSEPIDLTSHTMPEYRNAFALGPGHGICTSTGMLLVPVWMVPKHYASPEHSHRPSVISTFYSLDDGDTWQLGELLASKEDVFTPSETSAAELSDGSIYLNIRNDAYYRCQAISKTGFSDWTGYGPDHTLIDPICFGSTAVYEKNDETRCILFVNCESKTDRTHITLKGSDDDAATWRYRMLIDEFCGGYPEIAVDKKRDLIYLLYEEHAGEKLHWVVLKPEELFSYELN